MTVSYDEEREILRTSDDGRYRAVLIRDNYPEPPYDDGATPILRIETGRHFLTVEAHNSQAQGYDDLYRRLHDSATYRADPMEVFERYLKIFHGTKATRTYGPNYMHTDATWLAFDTDEWAERVGCPDGEPRENAAKHGLDETVAWLEGDVYGVVIEQLTPGACGHAGCAEHEEWEEAAGDSAIWGLYGDNDYSRVEVVDYHFADYFETTKAA